ncbi:hypothetical protein NZNM25_08880 [Nitrosopumilus zosterae]|uniref:Uncharacterized protein n=1 Tax=Nitrosopumilus zosterae TaxID=718286 RepID=A0A2S2KRA7_9ARCH|nr:hypothetical protein [Nitrosopumilus zosterae]BDQ30469.1 hypothetical protein NZOSNM25_000572 [Nitrosopumilus zosterae]GBH34097.1 hypothetical protein NZNM25_08880 [Nitrosopumilus zosterae]
MIGCITFVPEVLGAKQNLFEGSSSFERLPDTIIPGALYEFELKFQITDSPYWLRGMSPIVDITPKTDASSVHINFERIPNGFFAIYRVPVTLYVDQNISSEKIFLNISFVSKNSSGDELRSAWSESAVLNISQLPLPAELPSSQDYEFATMSGASCTYDSSVCFGMFHNGTTIPIQCDYRHSCGIVSFDKDAYKLEEKPPLKQIKHGIPIDEIQCKDDFVQVFKKSNNSPACVSLDTKAKLMQRGWAEPLGDIIKQKTVPSEPELTPLDIASIEDRFVHLNPTDMCATISLRLLSHDDLKQTKSGTKDVVFFELDEKSLNEFPILGELIRATHYIESPSNEHSKTEIGLRELVDYEFFIMEKAIAKYNDTQDDYFMKLDGNLDEKLADPKKQGFSNEFVAPQIVYRDKSYTMGSTVFWIADEHEMQSISIRLQDDLKDEKYITLTDKDMDSVPKIKQTIEKIGTELESIVAFKGVPENPDWNNYREWFDQKKTAYNLDDVYVKGFVHDEEYYDLGFLIC